MISYNTHQINIITNPSTNQTTTQSNTSQHITAQQTPSYNTHSILSAHSRHLQADMHYCLEKDIHNIYTSNIVVQSFNSKLTPGKRQINTWQQHTKSKRSNTQNKKRRHHMTPQHPHFDNDCVRSCFTNMHFQNVPQFPHSGGFDVLLNVRGLTGHQLVV